MLIQCCFDVGPTSKTVGGSKSRVYRGSRCIQRREVYYKTQCDTQGLTLIRGTRTYSVIYRLTPRSLSRQLQSAVNRTQHIFDNVF